MSLFLSSLVEELTHYGSPALLVDPDADRREQWATILNYIALAEVEVAIPKDDISIPMFEFVFGPSSRGTTVQERAVTSPYKFSFDPGRGVLLLTNAGMSAEEALVRYGLPALLCAER